MGRDILIYNGLLLTMEEGLPVVDQGAVLIRGTKILDCGETARVEAVAASRGREDGGLPVAIIPIDARGGIIMPGLINGHTHSPMSMFRGLADDLPLDVWLNDHVFPAEADRVNPESVRQWAGHSCREMLLSGTTTCCDGYFHEADAAAAMAASGIRAVAGQGVIDFPAPGVPDPSESIKSARKFVESIRDLSPRLTPSIFCHSPYTCSPKTLIEAKGVAGEAGLLFQIHAAETQKEIEMVKGLAGRSIISYLDDLGVIDDKTLLIHSVWVSEPDIRIIRDKGAGVVHCPESNMKLASGIAPVPAMIEAGIPVGIGTDGCASNNDHDLFSEMDMAAKLHKVAAMDPCVMDARTCVKMATIEGAKAIGLDHVTGSIEKGKQADIVIVDRDKPHMVPMHDPYSGLVYTAKASDVSLVMVDGVIRVRDKKLV